MQQHETTTTTTTDHADMTNTARCSNHCNLHEATIHPTNLALAQVAVIVASCCVGFLQCLSPVLRTFKASASGNFIITFSMLARSHTVVKSMKLSSCALFSSRSANWSLVGSVTVACYNFTVSEAVHNCFFLDCLPSLPHL